MRILLSILFCVFIANAVAPNGAVVTQSVTINSAYVSETATHFNLPFKVPRTGIVAANCDSAKHVALTGSTDTVRIPRWVVFSPDTIYIYADASKSSSVNKVYSLHFGKTLNEVNSASAFTNCGITSKWGFNESSGTTVQDLANGLNLTVGGGSTLGSAGVFYNGLTGGPSGYARIANNVMSGKTSFTHSMLINVTDYTSTTVFTTARDGSTVRYQVNVSAASNLFVYIGSAFNYGSIPVKDIPAGSPLLVTIVYDGSQPTNETRLKIYVNGVAKTITFTGTIPASIPTYTASPSFDIGGFSGGNYYVKGITDEMYLASQAVTDGYEADRYKALFTNTFWTLGTPVLLDTITLTCTASGYDSLRWFNNNVATDSTDSTYTIYADSAFYAVKHVIYCMAYNVGGSTKSGEWVFNAQSSTGSRRSAYKQMFKSAYKRAFK